MQVWNGMTVNFAAVLLLAQLWWAFILRGVLGIIFGVAVILFPGIGLVVVVALLLPSANNVAVMLARYVSGSTGAFVDEMNATAASLGMTGTRYTDPSGYEPTTVSTAVDQLRLDPRQRLAGRQSH